MYTILVVSQVLVAIALIGLILVQHGKGADAGAAFGSGASGTVFGARGAANFLTRFTAGLATVFFVVSLTLAYLVSDRAGKSNSVIDAVPAKVESKPTATAPVDDSDAPAAVPSDDLAEPTAGADQDGDIPQVPE